LLNPLRYGAANVFDHVRGLNDALVWLTEVEKAHAHVL